MARWAAYLDGKNGRVYICSIYAQTEEQARVRVNVALGLGQKNRDLRNQWQEAGSPVQLDPIY